MDNAANHFQRTFLKILVGLLEAMGLADGERDYKVLTEKAFDRSVTLWCTGEPNVEYDDNLSEKIVDVFGLDDEHTGPVRQAIQKARELAQKSILEAPYRIVSNFKEAADYMNAFAADVTRRSVMFGADTGYAAKNYAVFKLPYNDKIDFFYGNEFLSSQGRLYPGTDMLYLGFLNRETGILYDLRGPMELCWFDRQGKGVPVSESGGELKNAIVNAIKREVARRVSSSVPELPDTPPPDEVMALFEEVEVNYGGGKTVLDFADKVEIPDWSVYTNDPVRFIDEPEILIAEKADEYMKQHGDKMEKLWIAHLAAQKILSYTASLGAAVQEDAGAGS